jgi:hypothetical protein
MIDGISDGIGGYRAGLRPVLNLVMDYVDRR